MSVALGGVAGPDYVICRAAQRAVRPSSTANSAACVRDWKPSLARMLLTCVRAVRSLMCRSVAICRLVMPCATKASTAAAGGDHFTGQGPRHRRVDEDLIVGGRPDRRGDLGGAGVLEQIATGAGLERGVDTPGLPETGHHDNRHLGVALGDLGQRLEAVHARHNKVHEDDIGRRRVDGQRGQLVEGLAPIGRLTDHLDVVEELEVGRDPAPDDGMVVDDEDGEGSDAGLGGCRAQ